MIWMLKRVFGPVADQAVRDFEILHGEGAALREGLWVVGATIGFWLLWLGLVALAGGRA